MVEAKSKAVWTYLFSDKSQVANILLSFLHYVNAQFHTNVQVLRSDNGSQFMNKDLAAELRNLGIIHQSSCHYSPQQNGVVERKHRTLLNTARALRKQAHLPIHFWGDCVLTATYLLIRTPTQHLNGVSPYEILFYTTPDYSLIRTFGSLCYASNLSPHKDKFSDRALKCVFIGYPFGQKGYRVLHLDTKKVFTSRDVHFVEDVFPFASITTSVVTHLFPPLTVSEESSVSTVDPLCDAFSTDTCSTISLPESTSPDTSSPVPDTQSLPDISSPAPIVRPQRNRQLPSRFKDFTCLPTHLCNLTYSPFNTSYQHFHANVDHIIEPTTYKQACLFPQWCEAMAVELAALDANKTWELVSLPPDRKVVGCKWLYKVKYKPDGIVEWHKARLVAKGFTQTEGLDYFETFAPVAKMTTVHTFLALAAVMDWQVT